MKYFFAEFSLKELIFAGIKLSFCKNRLPYFLYVAPAQKFKERRAAYLKKYDTPPE